LDHWTDNIEGWLLDSPKVRSTEGVTPKRVETVTVHEQLLTTSTERIQASTTDDIRDQCTAVHRVLGTPCRTARPSLRWTRRGTTSQASDVTGRGRTPCTTDETRLLALSVRRYPYVAPTSTRQSTRDVTKSWTMSSQTRRRANVAPRAVFSTKIRHH